MAALVPAHAAGQPERAGAAQEEASHLVTVTGPEVTTEILSAVLHRLVSVSTVVCGTRTMATQPCTALEVAVRLCTPHGNAEAALRVALEQLAARCAVDISLLRADRTYGLVAFDVDNTLTCGDTIDRLASVAGGPAAGRAVRDDEDSGSALRRRVAALAGLPASVVDEVAASVRLMPGALVAVRTLQSFGIKVGAISEGLTPVVSALAQALRLDFFAANAVEVVDGTLTGRLTGELVDGPGKAAALHRFAAAENVPPRSCAAVGDGTDDIAMLTAAGLGVAFTAGPGVVSAADVAVSYQRLDLVLPMLGIPVPCALVGG